MKVNLDVELKDLGGDVLQSDKGPLTLRLACIRALLNENPKYPIHPSMKFNRWELAKRVKEASSEISLQPEDVVTMKTAITQEFSPLVVGPALEALEREN